MVFLKDSTHALLSLYCIKMLVKTFLQVTLSLVKISLGLLKFFNGVLTASFPVQPRHLLILFLMESTGEDFAIKYAQLPTLCFYVQRMSSSVMCPAFCLQSFFKIIEFTLPMKL